MALGRRAGSRDTPNIWPGFVDAMTALLLVLFFVISIFMIVQFVLSDTITTKDNELSSLAEQVAGLADALGLESRRADALDDKIGALDRQISAADEAAVQQNAVIASLNRQRDALQAEQDTHAAQLASYEEQVASLLAANRDLSGAIEVAQASVDALEAANQVEIDAKTAAQLALAQARTEVDAQAEAARLAAARADALRAMVADLEGAADRRTTQLSDMQAQIASTAQALFLAEANKRAAQERIQLLVAQNRELETGATTHDASLTQMVSELDAARVEITSLLAERTSLEQQFSTAEIARVAALATLAEREAQLASLTGQSDAAQAALDAQQAIIADAEANAARLATLLADRETAIAAAELALADRATELTEAERDLVSQRAAAQTARDEIRALEEARRVLEEDLSLAQLARIAVLESLVSARNEAALSNENLATAQAAIIELQGNADDVAAQIVAANAAFLAQQALTADAAANTARLAGLLAERDAQIAAAEQALADQEIDATEAARRISQANADLESQTNATNQAQANALRLAELLQDREVAITAAELALAERAAALDDSEKARLADATAAEALRAQLANAGDELTAMTLALEAERVKALEALTQLAAARAAQRELANSDVRAADLIETQQIALAEAQRLLRLEESASAENARSVALLNQQTAALRDELNALQGLLDASAQKDLEAEIRIESLGSDLNAALARVAAEQNARANAETERANAEARERALLEAEAVDLRGFRSEFFGRVREVLGEREGVQVVGDRFVFSSEVLFAAGSAELGADGKEQIARVAAVLRDVATEIPSEINWILRVDGHTDNTPLGTGGRFSDNWELSQARALSVVKYLIDQQDIPATRLAATGFGEFQPIAEGDSTEALQANRRIELKLTER